MHFWLLYNAAMLSLHAIITRSAPSLHDILLTYIIPEIHLSLYPIDWMMEFTALATSKIILSLSTRIFPNMFLERDNLIYLIVINKILIDIVVHIKMICLF